jgi:hypothetical protein
MMMKIPFRLEFLPNELLIYIFQYIQPRDLFHAFYNLNFRFNILLQTLPYLSFTLSINNSNPDDFFPYIRILMINRAIDINLNYFTRIRYLILRYPTDQLLAQLNHDTLPCLEHLCVNHMHISLLNRIPDLCDKIFSDIFPNLQSSYLCQWETITNSQGWRQSSSLRILKVGTIDLVIYKAILSSCSNLYFLQLATILPNNKLFNITPHRNLKRMIIKTTSFVRPWNDDDVSCCLSYVPCLEYLCVHRTNMMIIPKYDWLASMIACHLPCLQRFDFYLHFFHAKIFLTPDIEIRFRHIHGNRYQSRFIMNRTRSL